MRVCLYLCCVTSVGSLELVYCMSRRGGGGRERVNRIMQVLYVQAQRCQRCTNIFYQEITTYFIHILLVQVLYLGTSTPSLIFPPLSSHHRTVPSKCALTNTSPISHRSPTIKFLYISARLQFVDEEGTYVSSCSIVTFVTSKCGDS